MPVRFGHTKIDHTELLNNTDNASSVSYVPIALVRFSVLLSPCRLVFCDNSVLLSRAFSLLCDTCVFIKSFVSQWRFSIIMREKEGEESERRQFYAPTTLARLTHFGKKIYIYIQICRTVMLRNEMPSQSAKEAILSLGPKDASSFVHRLY